MFNNERKLLIENLCKRNFFRLLIDIWKIVSADDFITTS